MKELPADDLKVRKWIVIIEQKKQPRTNQFGAVLEYIPMRQDEEHPLTGVPIQLIGVDLPFIAGEPIGCPQLVCLDIRKYHIAEPQRTYVDAFKKEITRRNEERNHG